MHRSLLFLFLVGFCGGVGLAELWAVQYLLVIAVGMVAILGLSWRRSRWAALVVVGLVLGIIRWQTATNILSNSIARQINQTVTVTGDIVGLPDDGTQQIVVLQPTAGTIGRLQTYLPEFPQYHSGQRLTVRCTVEAFPATSHWRQWSRGIQARCFQALVLKSSESPPSLRRLLTSIENATVQYIHRSFNEPQASLLAGIILGNQQGMPAELTQAFQATGTTHIIALSGFNVTIIVSSVMVVLVRVIGRRWAWIPGLLLVIVFVVMSGASASVVRAAIMAVIVQLAIFLGRPVHPTRLLSYTALIMLWQNPLILLHDLGFQLSFLATIGLVFVSKPLAQRLTIIPEVLGLRENLATTLAAIIATEPLLLWQFGRLSLIAPLANILVLPFIPVAMGLGTLCLVGFLQPWLALPFVAVTDGILRLVLGIIQYAAHRSWSLVYLPSWLTMTLGTVFVFILFKLFSHANDPQIHPA